jgi:pilus assembly protein CpaF
MSTALTPPASRPTSSPTARIKTPVDERTSRYLELKGRVHQELLNRLNLERLTQISRADAEPEIRSVIGMILDRESATMPLSLFERETVSSDVLDELFGLGPLELLLKDPAISDILVNRADQIYIEREGRIEDTDVVFRDDKHLMQIIERIVSAVGRRIDESSPMVDARLQDGSRVNVIIPPLALDGPAMSIRRFRTDRLGAADLVAREALTAPMMEFLKGAIGARLNIIVSGGTGAGKTTMLNVLSSFVSGSERVVTIEDAAELTLRQRHVVRLETRPPNIEGKGGIRQRQLVINALRMRPDRIIVGEVRGEEALDMLQAMNTGHDGSLTTIHANSPRDALYRLDTMIAMANLNIPDRAVRQQVASAVNLVIQVTRLTDGSRRVTSIAEITGMEQDVIAMQEIFSFQQNGINEAGKVVGRFRASGIRPKCADRIAAAGRPLPMDMFSHMHPVNEPRHDRRS